MGSAWVEGGGQETQSPPVSYRVWGGGGGEVRVPVLALHTTRMHVDLSFSYLRFAEAASFDKKEFHRNCTNDKAWMMSNPVTQ